MAGQDYEKWEEVYRRGGEGPYPWDLGRPRDFLVQLMEKGMIKGDKALDIFEAQSFLRNCMVFPMNA